MSGWTAPVIIFVTVEISCGILLCIGSITGKINYSRGVRFCIFLAGMSALISGALTAVKITFYSDLSDRAYWFVAHYKTLASGFTLGALLTLFFSGAFKQRKTKQP